MNTPSYIKSFSKEQVIKQCKYLWGITLNLLYLKEENYELLDARIQSVINMFSGCNELFQKSPKIITACSLLETARHDDAQFRKCVMDVMGIVDEFRKEIEGGDTDV